MIMVLLLYLFWQASSAEKHVMTFFVTGSSELSNFSKLEAYLAIDEDSVIFCDSISKILKLNYDWLEAYFHDKPVITEWRNQQCFKQLPNSFGGIIAVLKKEFNQPKGVHVLQLVFSCDWDPETQKTTAALKYGYNGEDLIALNFEPLAWIALQPQAIATAEAWNTDENRLSYSKTILTQRCPEWLKESLDKGKSTLLRTEYPSLSLLQKSPSSPVSCHATGFYPNRALMFWKKDGEEIHENVDHGEILPNNDGTFQMSVYLDISSISPEDWRRYDCVFQLHDKEEIIKLDRAVIRTNRVFLCPTTCAGSRGHHMTELTFFMSLSSRFVLAAVHISNCSNKPHHGRWLMPLQSLGTYIFPSTCGESHLSYAWLWTSATSGNIIVTVENVVNMKENVTQLRGSWTVSVYTFWCVSAVFWYW
ncbi:major histocompatibility complex class I-related gene protein-like [Fundulus diaphanus]